MEIPKDLIEQVEKEFESQFGCGYADPIGSPSVQEIIRDAHYDFVIKVISLAYRRGAEDRESELNLTHQNH